jgi:hypothetical protein
VALAGLLVSVQLAAAQPRAGATAAATRLIDTLAASHDARVVDTLQRVRGTDRRLLALRSYLRAGEGLAARWSWTGAEIEAFMRSEDNAQLQREIEQVRAAFSTANPGYELWVNPEVRSLDTQLANWNGNASVGQAAARLLVDFQRWLSSAETRSLSSSQQRQAAREFLTGYSPTPVPTLAAPGLSPHGQMRAVDFQIQKDDRIVAGPDSSTIRAVWDGAGWSRKLEAAVKAGSRRFTGPLESPREPWHYTFNSLQVDPAP